MRVSVVADVHGNIDALASVADHAEQLVILGDLLDYVDYHDPAAGILGEIFGADAVRQFATLRARGAFAELHRLNGQLWASIDDPLGVLTGMVRDRYRRIVEVIPPETVVILGNVDVADEWAAVAGAAMPSRDGEVVTIDGVRFGFVAGGVSRRSAARVASTQATVWRPFIRSPEEYRAAVGSLPSVDVVCSHVPPDLAPLRYDVVPARLEMAGPGLTDYIDRFSPRLSLFGHVHQPLAPRMRRGMTECLNAGHFQRHGRALVLDTEQIRTCR